MAFGLDHSHSNNYSCSLCFNRKRCFLFLLITNGFIAAIYFGYDLYINESEALATKLKIISRSTHPGEVQPKSHRIVDFLKNTLEKEYDHNDLLQFYQMAEREFSLGLRCMRKAAPAANPAVTTKIASNATVNSSENTTTTIAMVSASTKINASSGSQLAKLLPRRRRRSHLYSFSLNNSDACANEPVDLVVIIISKSENYKTRDAIRRTWGSGKNLGNLSSIQVRFFFLIDFDEKLSSNIRLENELFHDIIQVELPQQYTLVTHRVLSLFEWSFRFCRNAHFLFKTDDDIFVNLIILLKFVSPLLRQPANNSFQISEMTIYGYKHYRPTVFRHSNDPVGARYVVTSDEFPCGSYPDFLSGFGYLISKKARDALVFAAYLDLDVPFRISDVYLTGILPDYLSLPRQPMADYNIRYQGNCENFFDNPKAFACAVGLHHGDTSDVFAKFNTYWQRVRQHL